MTWFHYSVTVCPELNLEIWTSDNCITPPCYLSVLLINNKNLSLLCTHRKHYFTFFRNKYNMSCFKKFNVRQTQKLTKQRSMRPWWHPEEDNWVEKDLRKLLQRGSEGNKEFNLIICRMKKHNANSVGSNTYFHKKIMMLKYVLNIRGHNLFGFLY